MTTHVYAVGLCYASVCTDETDEDATRIVNSEHPTGVSPWRIADESFASGEANPHPCEHDSTARHILFSC